MSVTEIFNVAGAVLASVGGATAILFGLSNWLGKVWANRLMQAERTRHEKELEQLKSELRRSTDTEIERLRHFQHAEMDVLIRRREIYEKVVVSFRVFLSSNNRATDEEKIRFLAAYDLCHLWASDSVIHSLGVFLDLLKQHTVSPGSIPQDKLRDAYADSILELRKDAGFPETQIGPKSYRIVSFL